MVDRGLDRRRILVVEDEYYLADQLAQCLSEKGVEVVGPVPSIERAMALLEARPGLDGAVLDINLGGEPVFPVADALVGRGVPVIFTTGYDRSAIPERFASVSKCEKPISGSQVIKALTRAIHAEPARLDGLSD